MLAPKGQQPEPRDAVHRLADRVTEVEVQLDSKADSKKAEENQIVMFPALPGQGFTFGDVVEKDAVKEVETRREKRVQISFCAGEGFEKKLDLAKEHLSNKFPKGKIEDILGEALDRLIELETVEDNTPALVTKNLDRGLTATNSRYIRKNDRKYLMLKSDQQCEWRNGSGERCRSKRFLNIDHIVPLSLGGKTQRENLQVLCSEHNQFKAGLDHGVGFMAEVRNGGRVNR
jgi:hypothetical protein